MISQKEFYDSIELLGKIASLSKNQDFWRILQSTLFEEFNSNFWLREIYLIYQKELLFYFYVKNTKKNSKSKFYKFSYYLSGCEEIKYRQQKNLYDFLIKENQLEKIHEIIVDAIIKLI